MDHRPLTRRTSFLFLFLLLLFFFSIATSLKPSLPILSLKAFKRQKHHELFAVNGHGEHHLSMKRLSLSILKTR